MSSKTVIFCSSASTFKHAVASGVAAVVLAACTGCATHATIVPFKSAGVAAAPTRSQAVGIFRSAHPFAEFDELGLISFRTGHFALARVYNDLRRESALHGAEAVVDLKIRGETHEESEQEDECVPVTDCKPDGTSCETRNVCTPRTVYKNVTTYLVVGSMIRRKP